MLRLSPGVCRKLQAGAKLYESSACAAKPASTPACGPAGLDGGTDGSIGGGVELVAKANNASSLVVMNNAAVFSTDDGLGAQNVLNLQQTGGIGGPMFKGQWRLAPGSGGNANMLEILNATSAAPLMVSNGSLSYGGGGTQINGEGVDVAYQANAFYFAMKGGSLERAVQPFVGVQQLMGAIPDPTAILATSVQGTDVIIVGDAVGRVQPCAIQGVNVTCGMTGVVRADTPIQTMVASGVYAYAALQGGADPQGFIYRANLPQSLMGSAIQGLTLIAMTANKDLPSLRLGLAVDANCAYFSNGSDVLYVPHGQSTPAAVPNAGSVTNGTLGIFGVAVGGGYVYFAVRAPIASGGAIYRTPIPQACGGKDAGSDAGGADGSAMFDGGG